MEMFLDNKVAQDDPRMATVHDHFRKNLEDIVKMGRGSGARVILSTVAVNLKDCAPFASLHGPGLTPQALAQWETNYQASVKLWREKHYAQALPLLDQAIEADPLHAEAHFLAGDCGVHLGQLTNAAAHFRAARDLDALRFRADSGINRRIREVAAACQDDSGVVLCDAEQALSQAAPSGIPGDELFHEHVHFHFQGNYQIARLFADQVVQALSRGCQGAESRRRRLAD